MPRLKTPSKTLFKAPASGVTIRMYRQGLGDCFLLAFPTDDAAKAFYVLIDCGVVLGAPQADSKMTAVVEDIEASTGGHIHLLVITHEHWDHVSGFIQAREIFERMHIHNLWFAWTEDPEDALAQQLHGQFNQDRATLRLAPKMTVNKDTLNHVQGLMQFYGDLGAAPKANSKTVKGNTTEAALNVLRKMANKSRTPIKYLQTGERISALPSAQGLANRHSPKVYVLGPPRDLALLKRSDPSAAGNEVYAAESAFTARKTLQAAVDRLNGKSAFADETSAMPFDASLCLSAQAVRNNPFFQRYYANDDKKNGRSDGAESEAQWMHNPKLAKPATDQQKPQSKSYLANSWRRIDDDWLNSAASELALKLDNDTNNTSLVLAVELPHSKKVLLLVGDAQVGNWLSWDACEWPAEEAHAPKITVEDLLRRTALYKVGHHGSHNATIRADETGKLKKGLELMNDPDLVAMLPVHQHTARKIKDWKGMPYQPLVKRLTERTLGRLLRLDTPFPDERPKEMSVKAWQTFRRNFDENRLYVQFTVQDLPNQP